MVAFGDGAVEPPAGASAPRTIGPDLRIWDQCISRQLTITEGELPQRSSQAHP